MKSLARVVCLLVVASLAPPASADRVVHDFDAGWRFNRVDPEGAEAPDYYDAAWEVVDVPHDWSIAGPFAENAATRGSGGWLPSGVAWYRKSFESPVEGRRLFVEFDGVMANSRVWINGHELGERPYGYVSFAYELTDHLKRDGSANLIAVRVDNQPQPASRWYTGAGIYRHVRLVETGPVRIARDGAFVMTPTVTEEQAEVLVSVRLDAADADLGELSVLASIVDPAGEEVAATSGPVAPEGATEVSVEIDAPELWGVDSPSLYQLRTMLVRGDETLDSTTTRFGVRTAEFTSDRGFVLNGERVKLKGVCLHHDGGAFGAAVPKAVWRRRFELMKRLGVNAVRTAHNPAAPEFLDLCDEMGLLVMDEFFDCWTKGKNTHDYHKFFEEWWERDLIDTVRRDRNHPSVVLYSVGNEIRDTHDTELAKRVLSGLVNACHAADPTRPVTQALFRPNVTHDYDNGLADLLDVVGTNYRDRELLQAWRDNPERKIVGTEQRHELETWLNCRDYPQHAGQFLWVGVDYLGESRRWPVTTFDSGLIDRTGTVYPRGAQRASWWSETPTVSVYRRTARTEKGPEDPGYEQEEWIRRRVLFDDWSPANRDPHEETVEVYSNCEEVELSLNGRSLGAKPKPEDDSPRVWKVPFEPGELAVLGRNGGEVIAGKSLRSAGEAAKLELEVIEKEIIDSWEEVAHVRVTVVDADGVRVPSATHDIKFTVEGPGAVVAVDNGSITSHESFVANHRKAFGGRATAYVQSTGGELGQVWVTASAEGLEPDSDDVQVVAPGE